jgi:DNA adenine methylase
MIRSSFRFPGGKERIATAVLQRFPGRLVAARLRGELLCYCEAFTGAGGMALKVLPTLPRACRVVLGDLDPGIVAYWQAVVRHPHRLCRRLLAFTPSADEFYRLKELDGKPTGDDAEDAFRKFVLHQMSFSGLGARAGGPLGGRGPRNAGAVASRFCPERHVRVIAAQHRLLRWFRSVELVHGDFEATLSRVPPDALAYIDPPYVAKGGQLYARNMSRADHVRLRDALRTAAFDWVLSYDDCALVRGLYSGWSDIVDFEMIATIDSRRGAGSRRTVRELVISRPEAVAEATHP